MKILDSTWFTSIDGTVGIVLAIDEITNEMVAYIGVATPGNTEYQDEQKILKWGAKLPTGAAKAIFGNHF